MKRDSFEPFPKVERKVGSSIKSTDTNLMEGFLVVSNGDTVLRYAKETPLVVYRCSEEAGVMPYSRLNTFIESINVSNVDRGKQFSLELGDMECTATEPDTIAYFTDTIGRHTLIPCHDVSVFLLRRPYLVISNEGLLVFFTEKEILATIDCWHYAWITDIDTRNGEIESIDVHDDYCIVNIEENSDRHGNPTTKYSYTLRFIIDMIDHGMIKPEVTKN